MTVILLKVVKRLGYVVATMIILAAFLVSVGSLLTPYLNDHLPDFEAWSSEILQAPTKIRRVQLSWDVYEPELLFDNVMVLDPKTNQPKFAIGSIKVNLNILRSLVSWRLIMQRIKVTGVHLTIRQPTSDKIFIEELKDFAVTDQSTGSKTSFDEILKWVFSEPNLIVEDVDINYYLPSNTQKSILIHTLALKNNATEHSLSGIAVLNQPIPTKVRIRLDWQGQMMDLEHISAKMYLYLEGLSLPQWLNQFSWHNLQIKEGLGSAKIWAAWDNNQLQKIQSQLQFYDVEYFSSTTHKTQQIQRISGHVGWKRDGAKQVFAGDDILIDLPDHLWPTNQFSVTTVTQPDGSQLIESVHIGYVDLTNIKEIAFASGLLCDALKKQWSALDLSGEVHELYITLPTVRPLTDLATTALKANFDNLSFHAFEKVPGVENVSGTFEWNGKQGDLNLDSHNMVLKLDKIFSQPLRFDNVNGDLQIQTAADGSWSLTTKKLQVVNADLNATTNMTMNIPLNGSPNINLTAAFSLAKVARISNYLPMQTFDADLKQWLQNAFLNGELENGKAIVQGNLTDFPFESGNGKFVISGNLKNVDLLFAPKWPIIRRLNGGLTFDGSKMTTDISSGEMLGIQLGAIHAEIPYIGSREAQVLNVQSSIQTDFARGFDFIHQSPLNVTLGKELATLNLKGPMTLKLQLTIPLSNPDNTKVQGDIVTSNAIVDLSTWNMKLDQLNGAIHFTEEDLSAPNLTGRLFDSPITLSIATQHEKDKRYVKANLQGTLSIPALQAWLKMPISDYVSGATAYQAELNLASYKQSQPTQILIKSDLKGIAINFPAPYGKNADESRDLNVNFTLVPNKPILSKIYYDKLLSAALSFDSTPKGLKLDRGQLLLGGGEPTLPAQSGLMIAARFKELDWSVVQKYMDMMNSKNNKTPSTFDMSLFSGVDVQADTVNLFGMRLSNARFLISKLNANWVVNVNSTQVVGQLTVPINLSQVQGKFQRFYFVEGTASNQKVNPKDVPALSISANDVRYGDKALGNVVLNTTSSASGMQINDLQMTTAIAHLQATGSWSSMSHLQGEVTTSNVSQMLTQLGMNASALVANNATMQFDLSWPGAPYNLSLAGLSGSLSFKLGPGRIINLGNNTEAKLGLGRLLNLLSLQSIPRRLSLNFSDLFENGYSFDVMKGDYKLRNGDAYTDNMRIEGPVANVSLAGRIGLRAKDYNMRLGVNAHVTSSLPVIATAATLNPLVGVATWAVDKVVSSQMSNSSSYDYQITGPWDNPVWTQIGGR